MSLDQDKNRHYSLRKLSVGLASVLIGISFVNAKGQVVKADSVNDNAKSAINEQAIKPEKQDMQASILKGTNEPAKQNAKSVDMSGKFINTPPSVQTSINEENRSENSNSNLNSNDVSSLNKNMQTVQNDVPRENRAEVTSGQTATTQPQNEKTQTSSAQNSAGKTQKNLLDDLDKQKTFTQAGNQVEDISQTQNEQKLDLTKNSKKFAKKVLATNLIETNSLAMTNGGFDSSWGTLDVNDWQGSVQGDYYQLTDYTGDANHVIVPNEADFEKAGISTSGKQVGVTSGLMKRIFTSYETTAHDATVAFSKTDDKQVKAINADWYDTWNSQDNNRGAKLSRFDGTNLDVSNVTDMSGMFLSNQIKDLSSLANWKVDNVTDMSVMFSTNKISNLSPLANWKTDNVTDMHVMFSFNQISNLSPLANWKVNNVKNMSGMFLSNQIKDLSSLANWNVDNVGIMNEMFEQNQISDLSPLANWHVNNVTEMSEMFDNNISSIPTKTVQAKRIINFVYPEGYTGKKQDPVTQTIDVPTEEAKVELTTKDSKPSNNILDWVTKTETPISAPIDPVYFQDYTVPEIKGMLEPDKTVVSREQADITKPINVTVTYKLVASNTNDAFALDSKHGLHEHANVNDNGGYDSDFWGKINVDDWNYTVNGDTITINGLKDSASFGANDAVIVPNLDDFKLVGKDGGAKAAYISKDVLRKTARHKYYGLSKTNGNTFTTDSDLNNAFSYASNLTHADLNSLNTGNATDMTSMFYGASSLTNLDVSNWDTSKVTTMYAMLYNASGLTSLDVSNWNTSNVTDMHSMFYGTSDLTNLDVSNWKTGKVTDMAFMFYGTSDLTSLDLSKWNTSNVTNMHSMFFNATHLTNIGDLSKWDTSHVTDMSYMFVSVKALHRLNISNWNLTKLANKDAMAYMFANDTNYTNLAVIANDLKLPTWYQNEINDADYFWNNHMAVITNVPELIKATGDINNLKIDKQDASRSIFYDSKGSSDAIEVLTDANNQYIADYNKTNPSKLLKLSNTVDQSDPISLANASFVTVPNTVKTIITYHDSTDNMDLPHTQELSGINQITIEPSNLILPENYELDGNLPAMQYGTNYLINVKHKTAVVIQQDPATRTINVHLPNGTTKVYQQVIGYQCDVITDLVTKTVTNGTWTVNDVTSSFTIDGVKQLEHSYVLQNGTYNYANVKLPKIPGYKAKISLIPSGNSVQPAMFLVSFVALPNVNLGTQNAPDDTKQDQDAVINTKQDQDAVINTKHLNTSNMQIVSNQPALLENADNNLQTLNADTNTSTWQIENNVADELITPYVVFNSSHELHLPRFDNYNLQIIKRTSNKDDLSFVYLDQNKTFKYVFNIKIEDGKYLLSISQIENKRLIPVQEISFNDYHQLIKLIVKLINK